MKLRSLNLASGSTMPSPILRVKILPQKWYGLGHMTLLKILNPLKYFWNDVATLIKFGEWINYGKSGVKFSPWKGHGLVHFSNGWGYPVGKWIDYSRSRSKGKIIPQKGHGMGHMIILGMKPLFQYCKCIDCGDCHTRCYKFPQNSYGVSHVTAV